MRKILPDEVIKTAAGYAIAAGSVAAALALNLLLSYWFEPRASLLFLAAVAVAAWRGGKYPSLLATALAVFAVDFFFQPPLYALELTAENAVNAVVFVAVALLISWIDGERKEAAQERDRLLESERGARLRAEEANRDKDTFLAMVTHDLRSPLNAVLGWTQMLQKNSLDAGQTRNALNVIERNCRAQAQLVEDLLDISRIRTGKFRLDPQPIDLRAVVEEATEAVAAAIAAKRISLERNYDRQIGLVNADADRLRQVVWNLLTNAVKFTPEDGRIEVRLERAGNLARLEVRDSGAGISPDFLPFIFDSFQQADDASGGAAAAKQKGLGLGLAIVRHLIEAHGGTVAAASAGKGCGATFTVELPLQHSTLAAAGQTFGAVTANHEYVFPK